jgi:hypothetical protein
LHDIIASEVMQLKTLKQIADSLDVDKQRVYRYIKKNNIKPVHHSHRTSYYDEAAEKAIIKAFEIFDTSSDASHDVSVLLDIIKQQQQTINDLTSCLRATQELHTGAMKTVLIETRQKRSIFPWRNKKPR